MSEQDTPMPRTLVAYVEDRPGVLNRVASLFRRRSYNIISLTVGRTHEEGLSRMTIVVDADPDVARRIEANLYKLVNVVSVMDITDTPNMVRDVALIKVTVEGDEARRKLCRLAEDHRARVVDVADDAMTLEVAGRLEKIDNLVEAVRPFGILEMVQSGAIAMSRGGMGPAAAHLAIARGPSSAAS